MALDFPSSPTLGQPFEQWVWDGEKWVIQCKRWRGTVGEPVVRDLYGVLHHEKADKGAIITTGQFTESAREWARGKPIVLYDGDQFLRSWKRVRGQS